MNEQVLQAMMTSLEVDEAQMHTLEAAGYRSIFDIARHGEGAFLEALPDLEPARARELHALARRRVATLLSLHRAYVARGEPVMQGIPKLGINPRPDELAEAVQRSLGGAPDFHDLFPERSKDGYAEAASIQSLFSPGRYLTELYKVARGLHHDYSPLNLDQRRPDIASLTLSEQNMTQELPTLDILTDVLLEGIAQHARTSISALETTYYPMTLPYHDNLVQIRSVLDGRDMTLTQVWSILADAQAQAFAPVQYQPLSDPAANIATPSPPVREDLQLAPATYALLVDGPASASEIQRDYRLPSSNIAAELRTVEVFTDRTGLTFNELVGLTGQYDPEAGVDQAKSRFYRYGSDTPVAVTEYGQTYLSTASATPDPLLIVPGQIDYALVGTQYDITYPVQGGTRTATVTLQDLFHTADGQVAYTAGFPADTYLLAGNYERNGQYLRTAESAPTTYTGTPAALVDFAGGAYVAGGQNGAPGPTSGKVEMAPYGPELQLRLTSQNAVTLADRAERLIRLQRQMGLEFHQLDWLVRNANLAVGPERANGMWLDQPVLAAATAFLHLRQTYGVSVDEFACFIGEMNTYAPGSQRSLYEALFTSDAYRITVPLDATINFDSAIPSDYQSIVAGGLGISTNELFLIAQAAFDDPAAVTMDAGGYARLYRAAAIPRMLGISFSQARLLWRMLDPNRDLARVVAGPATLETLAIIRQMETVLLWMETHQLDVDRAFHLVTRTYSDTVTPDLYNFVQNIYTSLSTDSGANSYQAGQPLAPSLRQKLYSLTASAFNVKPNVMGRLLQWIDAHFVAAQPDANGVPVPYGLGNYWADIEAVFSQSDADIKDLAGVPDVARYSQAMAQYALIALWAGLTEQDLSLVVETPQWFIDPAATDIPTPTLDVLLYLARLKQWQQHVAVPEAEAMGYFKYANAPDQTEADVTAMLAYLHGWDLETTRATNRTLADEGIYAQFPLTLAQLTRLVAWMQAGLKARIGSTTVGALYRMSWPDATAETASLIKQVAEQMTATLQTAPNASAMTSLKEARRDALVDYYIAYCIPGTPIDGSVPLSARIKAANDLYEYLLIDTKITEAVTTSRVGEAIAAVQLYIGRCLGGYDPDVNNAAESTMVTESRPGGFLYDWANYNQLYATWAGKERLQYYPSVYVNPGLRYNKTELFNALEETINQGRISEQRIEDAFQQYLEGFEVLADLATISAYQAGLHASADGTDTIYFVGRGTDASDCYWRSMNMGIRDDQGAITGGAWSQWLKIGAPTGEALDGVVRPCWFQNRLHVGWISRQEVGATGSDSEAAPTYQYFADIWRLQGSGEWVRYRRTAIPQKPVRFGLIANIGLDLLTVVFDYSGTWPSWSDRTVFNDVRPTIIGEPATGATLTGHAGDPWYPGDDSLFTYRWLRADDPSGTVNRVVIAGQTAKTYRLQAADRNKYIVFEAIPKTVPRIGKSGSSVSGQVGEAVGKAPEVSNLSITGNLVAGGKLTVNYSYYDADGDLEDTSSTGTQFQWYRNKAGSYLTPIHGATSRTYTVTSADYGPHTLLARVTPRSLTGAPNTGASRDVETAIVMGQPPTVTNTSITGALAAGSTLTLNYTFVDSEGDPEDTGPNGTLITWYRHKTGVYLQQISGAVGRTYTLKSADQGDHSILVRVTPRSATGHPSSGVTSEVETAVGVIGQAPSARNAVVSGRVAAGSLLTLNYDYYDPDGDPEGNSIYQWSYKAGPPMNMWLPFSQDGQGRSFRVPSGYERYPIRVEFSPRSRTGTPSTGPVYAVGALDRHAVAEDVQAAADHFSISGDLYVGSVLQVDPSGVAVDELGLDLSRARYEWFRHRAGEYTIPIPNASGPSYTLTGDDQGDHRILVRVTAVTRSGAPMEMPPLQTAQGVFGTAPTISNLAVIGNPTQVGATLTVAYDYEDADGDSEDLGEYGTAYQWFLQMADGNTAPLEGATERTFFVTTEAAAHGVVARVTPKSLTGWPNVGAWNEAATPALVSATQGVWIDGHKVSTHALANTAPIARNPTVLGKPVIGATLTANYEYFDADGDLEDTSLTGTTFQWYVHRSGQYIRDIAGATQRTVTVAGAQYGGHEMGCAIRPKSKTGSPNVGSQVSANTGDWVTGELKFMFETGYQWFCMQRGHENPVPLRIAYLSTSSAVPFSSALLQGGPGRLLGYSIQTAPIEHQGTQPIDFNGSYGLYFWEIFFHVSFLIANRYLTEQNYQQAQLWSHYVFDPAGYRSAEGELETIDGAERYWNVVPLQQDATWNVAIPPTVDPDAIAMNDPMHYKVAIFLQGVNTLIEQGDNAYRMLQRDYLVQAKMYYLQAAQMLGPRPPIDYKARWPNPSVAQEAGAIAVVDFDNPDARAPTRLTQLLSAYLYEQNGDFLPPYNADLLAYWDKLEVRFYNLRHHLTLDGQPMVLPLYAQPTDPRELQRRFGAGNGPGGNSVNANTVISQYRFPVLLERAQRAVKGVMRLGRELLKAIESRDEEDINFLLRTQRQQVLRLTNEIESTQIAILQDELTASMKALEGARKRLTHYEDLYQNWISSSEQSVMDMRYAAASIKLLGAPFSFAEAGVEMVPNIFGLACGGSKFGAFLGAAKSVVEIASDALVMGADRLDISEQYRRRRQDWQIERDNATSEVAQLEATIQAQTLQVSMARKQLALTKQELADEIAVHNMFDAAFTGPALYNWMCGRLAAIYYQYYSAALSLCLGCKAALAREIGPGRAHHLFNAPMWNDLYQGLLAGEGLLLELQQMENTYLKDDRRGLEIVRPVPLNRQIQQANANASLATMVRAALAGVSVPAVGGVEVTLRENSKLVITLPLDGLELNEAYGSNGKTGRLKNISVTLSPQPDPDAELEATLGLGGTYVALSHGVEDAGVFDVDVDDDRYLPFEGDPTAGTLVLTFFQAGEQEAQRALVEQLTDVTYQIRYTLKEH